MQTQKGYIGERFDLETGRYRRECGLAYLRKRKTFICNRPIVTAEISL